MYVDIYPATLEALCQSLGIVRSISQKERDAIDESDFAGPHSSFPIDSQEHLDAAAHLIGHADNPDEVKAKAITIAKRKGLKLPDAWQEDTKERAADGAIETSNRTQLYAPLMRIDATKREVWGQATAEVPDSYGTIFGYYPDGWKQWRGNIREQHDPKKAVGNRVDLDFDDMARAVYVGAKVSRGAQDTWLKVEDNVLTGYSASIIPDPEFGLDPKKWPPKEYNGKMYPYLPRYTVAELSLVDNPACPGCDIQIVRADGFATDVLDVTEEEPATPPVEQPLERAGARVSADTRDGNHKAIAHVLKGAVAMMQNCGPNCDSCMKAQKLIDPDGDGDIDIGSFDDPDGDADDLYNGRDADMERTIVGIVERALTPVYARLQGIAGTLARSNATPNTQQNFESIVSGAITRAIEAATTAHTSALDEVRSALAEVKGQVDKIADTPMPGAPVLNTSATMPRSVEKGLATDPYSLPRTTGSAVADAVAALSAAGQLNTVDKQVDAMAAAIAAQRRGQ